MPNICLIYSWFNDYDKILVIIFFVLESADSMAVKQVAECTVLEFTSILGTFIGTAFSYFLPILKRLNFIKTYGIATSF